jgi:bifunctional UDP-N-acetylglucosamine pyrophosphorylase/glucosamine-1-phosphate N-acetyltransferase
LDAEDNFTASAVILAAGLGTRMKSARPKAAHAIAGRPMLRFLLDAAEQVFGRITVVIGPGMDVLAGIAAPHPTAIQTDRLGTAHAALCAQTAFGDGEVAILFADNPLIRADTLRRLMAERRASGA